MKNFGKQQKDLENLGEDSGKYRKTKKKTMENPGQLWKKSEKYYKLEKIES